MKSEFKKKSFKKIVGEKHGITANTNSLIKVCPLDFVDFYLKCKN